MKKRFLGILFVIFIFSILTVSAEDNYVNIQDQTMRNRVAFSLYKNSEAQIKSEDLSTLKSLILTIDKPTDLSWVNYCTNLNEISIEISNISCKDALSDIKKLDNLEKVSVRFMEIYDEKNVIEIYDCFSEEYFGFITHPEKIKNLFIRNLIINKDFLYKFVNLETITISVLVENNHIDYLKFPKLKEVIYDAVKPYTLAMEISLKEIEEMKKAGMQIHIVDFPRPSEPIIAEYKMIDAKIEEIIAQLPFESCNTEQEKLDLIYTYILDNFNYDSQVNENNKRSYNDNVLNASFYTEGWLYGVFEKDTQICGNYAALLHAIANRVGLETYFVLSKNHAWNIVKLDGEYFYTDSTWVDTGNQNPSPIKVIGNHEGKGKIKYYLFDDSDATKESHEIINNIPWIKVGKMKDIKDVLKNNSVEDILPPIFGFVIIVGIIFIVLIKKKKKNNN